MIRSLVLLLVAGVAIADGTVSDNIRVSSDALAYDLQYRVYLPETYNPQREYPVIFLTDGQNYISRGRMPRIMNKLISAGKIEPVIAVFVDPRDPDNLKSNRRNSEFLCNRDYLRFYVEELIPEIEANYSVQADRAGRTIMGLSFGATNAACFGLLGYETFSGIAMQSPANHPIDNLLPAYEEMPALPIKVFLSTGRPDDNTQANRHFRRILQDKGYEMEYIEVTQGHDWDNWRPLLDNVLLYFYGNAS